MTFDFDKIIERRNTYSAKYDMTSQGKLADTIPLWVADMDFASPPCVLDAISGRVRHGVFGYFIPDARYIKTLQNWFSQHYDWEPDGSALIRTHGVVSTIYVSVTAFTEPGDSVIIQQPVYYPFVSAVTQTGRRLVVNQLVKNEDNHYLIDFDDFEKKIITENVKAFILCNPHNPVGAFGRVRSLRKWAISVQSMVLLSYLMKYTRILSMTGTSTWFSLDWAQNIVISPSRAPRRLRRLI